MLILRQVCLPVGKLKAALMRFQAAVFKFVLITPPKYSIVTGWPALSAAMPVLFLISSPKIGFSPR